MRAMSSLASGLPGAMAAAPARTASAVAQVQPELRLAGAGSRPWQTKQLAERIGRTSRLKSTFSGSAAWAGAEIPSAVASAATATAGPIDVATRGTG